MVCSFLVWLIVGFSKCDVAYNEGITYDTKETFIQLNNAKLFRHRRPELMVAENSCMFHLEEEFKPLDKTVKGEKIENDVIYIDPANFRPREGGAVFKGFLSRELPAHRADIVKSGFCIMRTKEFVPYMDLGQYDHLELRCRGDGRLYIMQIATKSAYDDDLFQYALPPLPANEWSVVHVPIDDFTLTYRGMVEGTQHDMHKEKIRHMGFMIAEPKEGEFKLELDYIRAVKRSKVKSDKRYSNGENILGQ